MVVTFVLIVALAKFVQYAKVRIARVCHGVWHDDVSETSAIFERSISHAINAIRDGETAEGSHSFETLGP